MKIYKFIETVKAKEPKYRMPTHYLKAKQNLGDQDGEFVASLWAKTYEKDGVKKNWLLGQMQSSWTDHTDPSKNREGFVIVKERDLNELLKLLGEQDVEVDNEPHPGDNIPF